MTLACFNSIQISAFCCKMFVVSQGGGGEEKKSPSTSLDSAADGFSRRILV